MFDSKDFFNNKDYDLKKSGNGRWIDQKCTPDVLWAVSDCISEFILDNPQKTFTVKDIWFSDYATKVAVEEFKKAPPTDKKSENEFDKFFAQPLSLLEYAGVLKDVSSTSRHIYQVNNLDALEYISINDRNSLNFLYNYIETTLSDSNLLTNFNTFFDEQTKESFKVLKNDFINFYHTYTEIKKDYEPKRIFTKVINVLAYKYNKLGTERGVLSKYPITKDKLMYNQANFRDIYKDKPKNITRQEWYDQLKEKPNEKYFEHQMTKAKKVLRNYNDFYNDGLSEYSSYIDKSLLTSEDAMIFANDKNKARDAHHIFPKNEFPSIMHYNENLMMLTPNQHSLFAHKDGTQYINTDAQRLFLMAQTAAIKHNLESKNENKIYSFEDFLHVLSVGLSDESFLDIPAGSYNDIMLRINAHYN